LNQRSQAPADAPFKISFAVRHQQAAPAPVGVSATMSVSFDDGKTWSNPQAATRDGDAFSATIRHPPLADTGGFVALRVDARDSSGASVQQTMIHAYGLTD
jgi:hypothetical protein